MTQTLPDTGTDYQASCTQIMHTNNGHISTYKYANYLNIYILYLYLYSISIPMCVCMQIFGDTYVCIYICICVCKFVCNHVYLRMCIDVYIYTYIQDRDNIIYVQYVREKQSQKTPAVIDHLFQLHILYRIRILKHNAIINLSTVQSCLQSRL